MLWRGLKQAAWAMAAPRLELNFFAVSLPKPFPFKYRALEDGHVLNPGEKSWIKDGQRRAVLVATTAPNGVDYVEELASPADVPPGILEAIATAALGDWFVQQQLRVDRHVVGFEVFRPRDSNLSLQPLAFARGLEFRADCLVDRQRQRNVGFFVSLRIQRRFADGAKRSDLLKAAQHQHVRVTTADHRGQWRLVAFDEAAGTAEVQQDGATERIPLADVIVPASATILREFGRVIGKAALAGDAVKLEQQLGFRYTKAARLNPNWLAGEYDFVKTWLIEVSQHGRIDFAWRASTLSMDIRPLQLEQERVR